MASQLPKPETQESIDLINLSPEIVIVLATLERKIKALGQQQGSIISAETLKVISRETRILASIAGNTQRESHEKTKKIRQIFQKIIESGNLGTNNAPVNIQENDATIICDYVKSLGSTPLNCSTVKNTFLKKEIVLNLKNQGIITIIIYTNENNTVVAWRLDRKQTELNKWLDRLFEHRAKGVILDKYDSDEFLKTIDVKQGTQDSNRDEMPSRRTFVDVTLFDGKIISVALATGRVNNNYIATWKTIDRK